MADKLIQNKIFKIIYIPALVLFAFLVRVYGVEIYGAATLLLVAAAMLVLSSRLTDAMLPTLLMVIIVTRLYDFLNNEEYMRQLFHVVWVAVPVIGSVIFHFVRYHKKFRFGRTSLGLCAISLALILGGIGTISGEEYFAGTALFYMFGLGLGMIAFYMLIKPHLNSDSWEHLIEVMYIVGISATLFVVSMYIEHWEHFINTNRLLGDSYFQSSNNISTILMIAMPFPLYYAHKNPVHIFSILFMYLGIVFTNSRGGLLMGTVELALILLAYIIIYPMNKKERIIAILSSLFLGLCLICAVPLVLRLVGLTDEPAAPDALAVTLSELAEKIKGYLFDSGQARVRLLYRMVEDFKSNPLFGVGIGYTGNESIYNPKEGAMNWYHMWFAQVIGGLGIVGILAYGYQLVERIIVFVRNRTSLTWTLMLSYVGLFLMSQVNPGEFCPMPYAMLGVTFFVVMENMYEEKLKDERVEKEQLANEQLADEQLAGEQLAGEQLANEQIQGIEFPEK